jgi:protein-arginine kinase activator protein McsA
LLIALVRVLAPLMLPPRKHCPPNKKDERCLACHGSPGMKSDKGKDISINPARHAASAHAVLGCTDCHTSIKDFPHPAKVAKAECATCHSDEVKAFSTSVHALLGEAACTSCHGSVHELLTTEKLAPARCTECHAQEVREFRASIHGQAASKGVSRRR